MKRRRRRREEEEEEEEICGGPTSCPLWLPGEVDCQSVSFLVVYCQEHLHQVTIRPCTVGEVALINQELRGGGGGGEQLTRLVLVESTGAYPRAIPIKPHPALWK